MECNAIRQAVCANEVVYDSVVEVPLENDVILPDYCPDIVKVLKCTVNACVSSTQVQGRQMTLEGMCTVHLLYLGEDSAGSSLQLRSIDTRREKPSGCWCWHRWIPPTVTAVQSAKEGWS